ncbi:hypothetical protein BDZ45DRAFT_752637 [Acephala macrosclerotiorum]|nr:hypothetical protein BDZ45DRAFT_752637 [Acephala macrosclerotiorum]
MIDALPSRLEILVLIKRHNDISRSKDKINLSMSKEEIMFVEQLEKEQVKIRGRRADIKIQMAASRAKPYLDNILELTDVNALGFPWLEAETIFHALFVCTQKQRQSDDGKKLEADNKRAKEIRQYKVWRENLEKHKPIKKVNVQKKVDDQKKATEKAEKVAQAEAFKRAQADAAKKAKAADPVKLQKQQQIPKIAVHKAASLDNVKTYAHRGYSHDCCGKAKLQSAKSIVVENIPQVHSRQHTNKKPDISPFAAQSSVKSPVKSPGPPPHERTAEKQPVVDLLRGYNPTRSGSPQPKPPPGLPPRARQEMLPAKQPVITNVKATAAAATSKSPQLKPLKPVLKKSIQNFKEEPGMKTWLPGMARPEVEHTDHHDSDSEKAKKARKAHEEALALRSEVRKF